MFMPYFVSWIVAMYALYAIIGDKGIINQMCFSNIRFYAVTVRKYWPFFFLIAQVRKYAGQGSVIYLASITCLDGQLYEVAYRQAEEEFQKATRQVTAPEEKTVKALTGESQLNLSVVNGMPLKYRAKLKECQRIMEEAKAKRKLKRKTPRRRRRR